MFEAPIPGQSLTKEPKNFPWERPPEMADIDETIAYHLDRLSKPDSLDNLLLLLESGMPVNVLVETVLTTAVMGGLHSIDVSMIVAPVLHEYFISIAEDAEIDYKEYFTDEEGKKEKDESKIKLLLRQAVANTPDEEKDSGYELVKEMSEAVESKGTTEEEVAENKPKGLMSRGSFDD